jgi:DNA-binding beta-propeller fold protein YncE
VVAVERVVPIGASPWGMVLTHDGKLLVVAGDNRVAFVDATRLIAGVEDPVIGYLDDSPSAGRVYANVSADDRFLFLSDETAGTITVMNLEGARANGFNPRAIVGQIPVGRAPIALAFSSDGRYLYTTSQSAPSSYQWPRACRREGAPVEQPPNHPQGVILVVDVARAVSAPASAVVGAVGAGCNPVRLVTSPKGDRAYVTARGDDAVLVFDTERLLQDTAHALIGRVPVGRAPVGIAVVRNGGRIVVTNSDRFAGGPSDGQVLTVIDAERVDRGPAAVVGTIPAGAFPRELWVTADQRTLLLTNYGSRTLEVIAIDSMTILHPASTRTSVPPPAPSR